MGGEGGSIDIDLSLSVDCWLTQSIDFDVERGGWVRMFFCEFLMSHDSNCTTLCSRFSRWRRSMSRVICRSIFVMVCRSMYIHWHRLTPMWSAETHGAFNFEVSFSKLLMLHRLPEIIIYDCICVVFCFLNYCLSCQGFLPLYSVFSLNDRPYILSIFNHGL